MSSIFEPISSGSYKQIEVRQTKISGSFRDNETISWLNSNGAFVRLKSSVDIIDENIKTKLGYPDDQPYDLASRYTLQGGIRGGLTFDPYKNLGTDSTPEYRTLGTEGAFREGIVNPDNPAPAYGVDSAVLGLKPMPGIEKVSIKTVGEGYLREATINIRVNSPEQLNIIDVLYFRIGYSVLLEWGHTAYFDNEENFINGYFNEIILADKSKDNILKEIEEKRAQSSYNYDAMFGVVENFQWDFRDDGGYDVTLKIISTGDIVDSLKINGVSFPAPSQDNANNNEENLLPYIKEYNKSTFHKNLVPLIYSGNGAIPKIKYGFFESPVNIILPKDKESNTKWWNWIIGGEYTVFKQFDLNQYKEFADLNFSHNVLNNPKYNKVFFIAKIGEQIITDTLIAKKEITELTYNCYIKLYSILDLLNNLYSINNYLKFSLDNPISAFYPSYSISVDPNTCITPPGKQWREDKVLVGGIFEKLYNQDNSFFLSENTADLREAYIEVNKILSIFNNNIDEEGNLTIKSFLSSLLQEINSSTGYSNNFKIIQNNNENLEIISLFNNLDLTVDKFEILKQRKIENFGNKTIFKSISLNSELTNEVSSQIAISAQVDNTDINGEKGDIFAYFNKGIIDRIIPKKETEYDKNTKATKREILQTQYDNLSNYIYNIYPIHLENGIVSPPITVDTAKKYLKEILTYVLQNDPKTKGVSILIPINLSFIMQGFSGFKLFNEFIIPTDFLPTLYKASNGVDPIFKFVVKGISHDISINKWDTSIETFMGPIPSQSPFSNDDPFISFSPKFDLRTEALERNQATIYSADATNVDTPILRENLTFITNESVDDTLNRIINQ